MLSVLKYEGDLDGMVAEVRNAMALTPGLFRHVVRDACTRFSVMEKAEKTAKVDRLVEVGAWCDAVLALVEVELPAWSIRRVVREDGEWFCSLTREPNLPAALDDTADASHQTLPLAILCAFLEARRRVSAARAGTLTVPRVRPLSGCAICCDNFG